MNLTSHILSPLRDYCIQQIIRKGKEEKVYRMLVNANNLLAEENPESIALAKRLNRRACRIADTYSLGSKRTQEECIFYKLYSSRHNAS